MGSLRGRTGIESAAVGLRRFAATCRQSSAELGPTPAREGQRFIHVRLTSPCAPLAAHGVARTVTTTMAMTTTPSQATARCIASMGFGQPSVVSCARCWKLDEEGQVWSEIGQLAPIWLTLAKHRPTLARIRPNFGTNSAKLGPETAKVGTIEFLGLFMDTIRRGGRIPQGPVLSGDASRFTGCAASRHNPRHEWLLRYLRSHHFWHRFR